MENVQKTAKSSVCINLLRSVVQICQWICILVFSVPCFKWPQMKVGQKPAIIERGETYWVMCEVNMLIMLIGLSDPSKCYSAEYRAFQMLYEAVNSHSSVDSQYIIVFDLVIHQLSCYLQRSIINRTGLMPPTHQFSFIKRGWEWNTFWWRSLLSWHRQTIKNVY